MTQKEKDWVIRIQLLQLQTDDPYTDDYYYTTFVMRKLAGEVQKKKNVEALESVEKRAEGEEEVGEELEEIGERRSSHSEGRRDRQTSTSEESKAKSGEEPKLLLPPRVTLENRSYIPVKVRVYRIYRICRLIMLMIVSRVDLPRLYWRFCYCCKKNSSS